MSRFRSSSSLWRSISKFNKLGLPILFCSRQTAVREYPFLLKERKLLINSFIGGPLNQFSSSSPGPAAIDYRSLLREDEFHRIANNTIHSLQEKIEEYGDSVKIDGFDVEYSNEVLTIKLGSHGTYVLNKQSPNRQLWLSSPLSGPSRFDWDKDENAWIYRRTKANILTVLENELAQLCGDSLHLV